MNTETEYPWSESYAVYLVGSEWCHIYELLRLSEIITDERYRLKLICLKRSLADKIPE